MGLEHPQPSRGANSPQIAGSNSNLKLALGLSQLEAAGICIALIKDSLSRHNETESEQPARCSAFPRGPPWVMFRGMIHIPHLGNLRSHGTGRELCPPGPSRRRQTGGFNTQFMTELLILGDLGLKKCIFKKSQAAFRDADTCSCLAAPIWLECTS